MKYNRLENGAVEILDFDISTHTAEDAAEMRDILLRELVVVIKKQDTNPLNFARLIHEMGGLSNWNQLCRTIDGEPHNFLSEYPNVNQWDKNTPFPIQPVTGEKKEGEYIGIFPTGLLDWHCNLNGPDRADGVALQGIKGVDGTRTSWLNTAIALAEMPDELRDRIRGKHATFYYNPEKWAFIANDIQRAFMLANRHSYKMWIEQENAGGVEGIYLYTNNDCKIPGEDTTLFTDLQDFLFQEKYMYHHDWSIGDIVLSDQLITLHKRRLEDDDIFEKRLLNRLTFRLTNQGNPPVLLERNKIV